VAPFVELVTVYTSPVPIIPHLTIHRASPVQKYTFTGYTQCIAGESIFLDRASPVAIYSCWLCTGLALCIASF